MFPSILGVRCAPAAKAISGRERADGGAIVGGLTDRAGRSLPAAEARSLSFAALRRLRPAHLSGGFISTQTFAGDPVFAFGPDGTVLFGGVVAPSRTGKPEQREQRRKEKRHASASRKRSARLPDQTPVGRRPALFWSRLRLARLSPNNFVGLMVKKETCGRG